MMKKRKVLEEEQYIQLLEEVIEKNYFPHLSTLSQQLDYLNQQETFDVKTLRHVYSEIFPTLPLPSTSRSSTQTTSSSTPLLDGHHMSIPEFFNNFISEDNYSFLKVQEKDLKAFRQKYHWAYDPSQLLLTNGSSSSQQLQIEDGKKQRAGMLMLYYIDNKVISGQERERIDRILNGEDDEQRIVGDNRPNTTDTSNFRVRNAFLFPPDLQESEKISQIRQDEPNGTLLLQRNPILPITNGESSLDRAAPLLIEDLPHPIPSSQTALIALEKGITNPDQYLMPYQPATPLASRPSKLEKVIQRENVYQPGMQFVQEIDQYLRKGHSHDPSLPSPLESPHTPTTISSYPSSELNPLSGPPANSRLKNDRYVSMSPRPQPGIGLLSEPLMTWGKVIGPIMELESEVGSKPTIKVRNPSSSSNINLASTQVLRDSSLTTINPSLPHFYLNPMNSREQIAYQLDAKRYQKKDTDGDSNNKKPPVSRHSSIFGDQYTPLRGAREATNDMDYDKRHSSSASVMSYAVSVKSTTSTGSNLSRPRLLHEMSPAAQLIAKRVQSTLQQKIFQSSNSKIN